MTAIYKGFSTNSNSNAFTLEGIELVKQDLLNHIHTQKGERVMMPAFGTNIQSYIMEPNDSIVVKKIEEELKDVINADPRVELVNMNIDTLDHLIQVSIELIFQPGDIADNLFLQFTRDIESIS